MPSTGEALLQHLLWRNFLRGRKPVPQDVAQVESAWGAHEDRQDVHLGGEGEQRVGSAVINKSLMQQVTFPSFPQQFP